MRLRWAAAALALWAGAAHAQDDPILAGTLKTIAASGTIRLGVRDTAIPFSFTNKAGQPIGFSVDICTGIATDAAALLHRDLLAADAPAWQTGLRIAYVPITAEARLRSIVSGAIDLECGSTTANAERSKTVGFSPVFFLAGTKLLAPIAAGLASYRDLAGKRVAVGAGTTNAAVLHRLAQTVSPPITVSELPNIEDAYHQVAAGQADAMASDDVLLAGLAASHPDGQRFAVIGDFLSFEPYAVILRRDDPAFATLVRASFERMAADGFLAARYRRWFTDKLPGGETLNLPISAQLSEIYRALGQPD
jgi:glutamate/aspartate transport system substrate-binding protein